MIPRLRGHHLLCVLTYQGHGYNPSVTAQLDQVVDQLNQAGPVELVAGPDDICAPLIHSADNQTPHCLQESAHSRDRQALKSLRLLFTRRLQFGERFEFDAQLTRSLRMQFAKGNLRMACQGCEWHALCTQIAADGFQGLRLHPNAK